MIITDLFLWDTCGIGFDEDAGTLLELHDLNLAQAKTVQPMSSGSIKTRGQFSSLGWSATTALVGQPMPMGISMGGIEDGTVHAWNPNAIMNDDTIPVTKISCLPGKRFEFNSCDLAFF